MISPILAVVLPLCIISIMALLSLCSTGVRTYATPIPIFGPLDHVYNLIIANQSYPIRYGFSDRNGTAVIESMSANYTSKLIKVMINDNSTTTEERFFIIELPRNVLSANTTELAGGCSSGTIGANPPTWVQEHDLDYRIVVSIKDSEGDIGVFPGSQNEECGPDSRILSIEYLGGKNTIMIQGTAMIPEFGLSLSPLVMTIAIVGVMGISIAMGSRVWKFRKQ